MNLSGKKVLVTGARGMLAADLIATLQQQGAEIVLSDLSTEPLHRVGTRWTVEFLDICSASEVQRFVAEHRPQWVVNCAAYTAVDKAETEGAAAIRVNGEAVGNLAHACKEHGAKLLHISSDYVFGGNEGRSERRIPYNEDDEECPCGTYGESKYQGDCQAREILGQDAVIARTSWLHGVHGPNFLQTMLRLAREQSELKVVSDQIGVPTYAGWLAGILAELIARDARGTFHTVPSGEVSWCEYAREIFRRVGVQKTVMPVTTEEFRRPAPRPRYSVLSNKKLSTFLGRTCPTWQQGVAEHLTELQRERRENV